MKKTRAELFKLKGLWLGLLLILAGLLSIGLVNLHGGQDALASVNQTDLIKDHDWSHMTGASVTPDGISVQALGRAIVNQNGTPNQTNPPVNARGPHVVFDNNVQLSFTAAQIPAQGSASLYMYSAVPRIYDEWRYQPPQLRLDLNQQSLTVYEWNGRGDKPSFSQTWNLPVGSGTYMSVSLSKKSKTISLQLNGMTVGDIKTKNLFNSGQIWFGADNSLGNSAWLLKSLTAQTASGAKLKVVDQPPLAAASPPADSLSRLSAASPRQLPIGAAIASYPLFSDPQYRQLVGSQINMLVPENELKAQFTEPQPNVYTFTDADNLVDFALANGLTVHGHNLVFSEANPQWMQSAPLSQRQQIMTDHITTEVSHFGSKINEWDVVDEPLNDNDDNHGNARDLRSNIWFKAMGEQYIDIAFQTAHAANPSAQLYINEYGLEASGSRWDEFLSLIQRLQARGVPIDGVGFQAHVYEPGDEVDRATLENHIQTLANMGLKSRISEMDVYGEDPTHQASQYADVLKACLDQPSCTSFTMWGLTDKYGSTTDYHTYPLSYGNDLVWDENFQAKPAYGSLQATLKSL